MPHRDVPVARGAPREITQGVERPLAQALGEERAIVKALQAASVAAIQAHLTAHPNPAWTLSADETYVQILRDYESVRIPMQHGAVTTTPGRTRNPAAGFLQFTRSFTEVMANTGRLRWGGTSMGMESGDMMHFDLDRAAEAVPAGVCAAGPQSAAATSGGGGGS